MGTTRIYSKLIVFSFSRWCIFTILYSNDIITCIISDYIPRVYISKLFDTSYQTVINIVSSKQKKTELN